MAFQMADVTKPMPPPGRITSTWHRLVIGDDDDTGIQHWARGGDDQVAQEGQPAHREDGLLTTRRRGNIPRGMTHTCW